MLRYKIRISNFKIIYKYLIDAWNLHCKIIADSESPVSFSEVREAPPDRRLSEELRRCKSLRYAKKPPLISKKTRQITLTSSKSFDADVLAAILNVEDDIGGKFFFSIRYFQLNPTLNCNSLDPYLIVDDFFALCCL